jgi:hypothetical protein
VSDEPIHLKQEKTDATNSETAPSSVTQGRDAALSEEAALNLLAQPDLNAETLEGLARDASLLKFRKVKLGIIAHAHTPRHVSLPLLRQLYTFDLMRVALTPVVAGDLKRAAEELLLTRLESISAGERASLARRASGRVAGALLLDKEPRVMRAALQNSRLTEANVVQGLMRGDAPAAFVEAIAHHAEWSVRREVRAALLRNAKTPMAKCIEFARSFAPVQLREILQNSRLPENIKSYLLSDMGKRGHSKGAGR